MDKDRALRDHLLYLLRGGGAHIDFDTVVEKFPVEHYNDRVRGIPYSAWQVLEHMRIAQWDILEFSRSSSHISPDWPEGYWPSDTAVASEEMWKTSVNAFRDDLNAMANLVADPASDLFTPIKHGDGQTLLREALLVADHNAYHLGVIVTLRKVLTGA